MQPIILLLDNVTQGTNHLRDFWSFTLTDVIIAASAVIAVAFGIVTAITYQKRQTTTGDRQYQLSALLEVFRMMNDKELKFTRETLYNTHEHSTYDRQFYRDNFDHLRSILDMIGYLYHTNAVPRKVLLEMYWYVIIHCWVCLEPYIMEVRKNEIKFFSQSFEILKDAALVWHHENFPDHPLPT